MSPSKADSRELLPEPTPPTTATSEPLGMCRFIFFSTGSESWSPHVKKPFSIRI